MQDDEALMTRVMQDDRVAYELLYARWREPIFRFLLRRTGARSTAEEAHQETWLRVHRFRNRFDRSRSFRAWLFTIAANCGHDAHRPEPELFELPLRAGEPEDLRDRLVSGLASLDPEERRSSHTSNCDAAWGDVYGVYLSGWAGDWGVSVGGELVHLTIDLPGYGSSFGADEPWVFDARAVFSTDGIMGQVSNPNIHFWTYGYEVDAAMNAVTDGAGDLVPMLDADVYLGNHTLSSGWYEVTGLWFYGIVEP